MTHEIDPVAREYVYCSGRGYDNRALIGEQYENDVCSDCGADVTFAPERERTTVEYENNTGELAQGERDFSDGGNAGHEEDVMPDGRLNPDAMAFVRNFATYAPESEARDIAQRIWDNATSD